MPRGTASDKVLRYKAFNIGNNSKIVGYQRRLPSVVYKFFDKQPSGANTSDGAVKLEAKNYHKNYTNQLLENLKNEKDTHLL